MRLAISLLDLDERIEQGPVNPVYDCHRDTLSLSVHDTIMLPAGVLQVGEFCAKAVHRVENVYSRAVASFEDPFFLFIRKNGVDRQDGNNESKVVPSLPEPIFKDFRRARKLLGMIFEVEVRVLSLVEDNGAEPTSSK